MVYSAESSGLQHIFRDEIQHDAPRLQSDDTKDDTQDDLQDGRHILYIGGLFELDDATGRAAKDAALEAVQDINDQELLPGVKVQLVYNDTKVNYCLPDFLHPVLIAGLWFTSEWKGEGEGGRSLNSEVIKTTPAHAHEQTRHLPLTC